MDNCSQIKTANEVFCSDTVLGYEYIRTSNSERQSYKLPLQNSVRSLDCLFDEQYCN